MIDISEYPESNLVLHDAFYNDLVQEFGQPTEQKGEFTYWDTDWGNIIYAQTKERFFALHFTSSSVAHNLSLPEIAKSLSFPLLAKLKRSFFWNLIDYTEEEIRRWLWLRAIEWTAWPTFISQPIVPVLFIFFTWWHVLITLLLVNVVWTFIRYRYVNFYLAQMGTFFVLLKWPASILSCIYLLIERRYGLAILTLLWPLVAGIIGIPGKVGKVELLLAKKIGYVSEDAEL